MWLRSSVFSPYFLFIFSLWVLYDLTQLLTDEGTSVALSNSRFVNCSAGSGGAIVAGAGSSLSVSTSVFSANTAVHGHGGAVSIDASTAIFVDTLFDANTVGLDLLGFCFISLYTLPADARDFHLDFFSLSPVLAVIVTVSFVGQHLWWVGDAHCC